MHQLVSTLINAYLSLLGRVPVVGLLLAASISVIVGDYAAKAWSQSHREWYLFLAFAGYFFSGFFYIPTLLRDGLIVTSVIWVRFKYYELLGDRNSSLQGDMVPNSDNRGYP